MRIIKLKCVKVFSDGSLHTFSKSNLFYNQFLALKKDNKNINLFKKGNVKRQSGFYLGYKKVFLIKL
jgi:hypothetical protein